MNRRVLFFLVAFRDKEEGFPLYNLFLFSIINFKLLKDKEVIYTQNEEKG